MVLGSEVNGRCSQNCSFLLSTLADYKVQSEMIGFRTHLNRIWRTRWSTLLAVAIQNSVSAFAVDDGTSILDAPGYKIPFAADICTECASIATLASDIRAERARDSSDDLNPSLVDFEKPYPGINRLNTSAIETSGEGGAG